MTILRSFNGILNRSICCLLCVSVLLTATLTANTQTTNERETALSLLWNQSRPEDALPLLEKLAATNPEDGQVVFSFGFALLAHAKLLKTPEERKQTRLRARTHLLKAQQLGIKEPLLLSLLEAVPPDGGRDDLFSNNATADASMRDGEAAFVKGQFAAAANAYQKALEADPKLYEAALFAGDMYFKMDQFDKAEEWYARAIQIDPNRETGYRYSATPFLKTGKLDTARARYVEAVIAEPYNRMTWAGLSQWAERAGVDLGHPKIEIPTSVTPQGNNTTVKLDPKMLDEKGLSAGLGAWMMYGLTRTSWNNGEFAKAFPKESSYRHSLLEEAAALRSVIQGVKLAEKEKRITQLDPSLVNLVKLNDEGLLESYILFALADRGIAQDYAEYRRLNRDKLRRYLMEYVTATR